MSKVEMTSRRLAIIIVIAAVLGSAAVWLVLRGGGHPNVILISIDTLRPDHLGCYGYAATTSPNIDALSREGITFEDASTSAPLTLPSHTTMLTGLYPISHGIRNNGSYVLDASALTMTEIFKEAGYATGAFVGSFVLDSRFGLDQGFDVYNDDMQGARQPSAFGYMERTADEVTDAALGWLDTAREPFFAFVHYFDPHAVYMAPPEYRKRHPGNPYDAEIDFTDHELGRLIRGIADRGVMERTLVVLVSDHGEGLGEHEEATHGVLTYDTTLRVPMIMRLPENSGVPAEAATGKRISPPVRLVDLMPTVLDIAGLRTEAEMDGRSLVPLMRGERLDPEFCYFETLYPYFAYRWSPLRGVRFNEWKYILSPEPELYNVAADPSEMVNLIDEESGRAAGMEKALLELMVTERGAAPAGEAEMSAEEARKLAALGYVSRSNVDLPEPVDLTREDPKIMIGYIDRYLIPGEDAYNSGDLETALAMFTDFAELDPGNPEAHIHVGRTLLDLGKPGEAALEYEKAIRADSTNSTAHFYLGAIAQLRGALDEALRQYEEALRLTPGSPEALANMGGVLLDKGMTDSAVVVLQQALVLDPGNEITLVDLGLASVKMEMDNVALRFFRAALETNPDNVKALNNCAAIYLNRGNVDSSLYYFKRASEVEPDNPQHFINLGSAYRQKRMPDEAGKAFEKALELDPDNVLALFGLGAVRISQQRPVEARALFERALEIDPTFEAAREILAGFSKWEKQ
jgi:arylsulfatase A-like enzyme/Flp pilus assembly protein TadD